MQPHTGPTNKGFLRIEKAVYGGDGLARTSAGEVVFVPFSLPGELVERPSGGGGLGGDQVLEASPARVQPRCVHFGVCGGCHYQMAEYPTQLGMKTDILRETLERAGIAELPEVRVWGSPEPWGYRNRIRLRVRAVEGAIRLGYNLRGTREFLPITMCPIAAPVLWRTAEALTTAAVVDRDAAAWVDAAAEIELFCDAEARRVQLHLLCPGAVPRRKGSFDRFARRLEAAGVPVVSLGASVLHTVSGRALESLDFWGAEGLAYRVDEKSFWLERGSFFQVNRFLLPAMVDLVCHPRQGALAWDLYAGAGLFARELTKAFAKVTAVEANPAATYELRRGLRPGRDLAVEQTTLDFLRRAVLQRERPDLIVLDPPRAGAGEEACRLLLKLAPDEIVYVSCDPTTLVRDLKVLSAGYRVAELHMVDLFPQTYHLETVMVLHRKDVEG